MDPDPLCRGNGRFMSIQQNPYPSLAPQNNPAAALTLQLLSTRPVTVVAVGGELGGDRASAHYTVQGGVMPIAGRHITTSSDDETFQVGQKAAKVRKVLMPRL